MKKKKSIALLISAVIGIIYTVYLIVYFSGAMLGAETDMDLAAGSIAMILVTPHMVCVAVAAILNLAAWLTNKRALALTCAILYAVAAVIFIFYALFLVPSIILSFIGFVRLKKVNEENAQLGQVESSLDQ